MITALQRFLDELRREGVAASPAEWLDAMRAVEQVGLASRERFRAALRCTLVKRASELPVFDRTFDRFFAGPRRGGADGGGRAEPGGGTGRRPGAGAAADRPRSATRRREERSPEAHAVLPGELRPRLDDLRRGRSARAGRLRRILVEPRRQGARDGAPLGPGLALRVDPLRRELRGTLDLREEREIAALVPRVVERIRLRAARRLRRARRGRLYLRRVFRDNLRHDGVPWVLPVRTRRHRRSRVVLLVDVSWSTARAAGLFLSIAGELLRRRADTRILLFVDRAVDATAAVERWLGGRSGPERPEIRGRTRAHPGDGIVRAGGSFAGLLAALDGLDLSAASDYGRTFDALERSAPRIGGRTTVLVVLGDGRTNRFDPQGWAFEELAARCGSVLWLVPEPVDRWDTGDSALRAYLPHVDVAVEAADVSGLARGVRELLRRL